MRLSTFLRSFLSAVAAVLITLSVLQAQSKAITAIKAGNLVDTETGRVLSGRIILVEDDTIKAVSADIPIPENATVIDLRGATVFPGLIDCHVHITTES